jgi:hypothetical protein
MRGKEVMRIVLIGVSHWHTPFYSDPVLSLRLQRPIVGDYVTATARGAGGAGGC